MRDYHDDPAFLNKMSQEGQEEFALQGDLEDLRSELHQLIDQSSSQKKLKKPKTLYLIISSAAAVILAIMFFNLFSADSYDAYFSPPPFVLDETTRDITDRSTIYNEVLAAYDRSDWENVLSIFEEYPDQIAKNKNLIVYKGIAEVKSGHYNAGEASLTIGLTTQLRDIAQWYLVELYLKKNESGKAKKLLMNIRDDNEHYKREDAILLIRELD